MYYELVCSDELYHHGIKGMKWGVRKDRYTRKRDKILSKINRINSKNNRNLRAAARIQKDAIDLKKNGFPELGTEVMKVANDQHKKGIAKRNKQVEKLKGKLNKRVIKKATKLYNKEYDRAETEGYKNSKRMQSSVGYKGLNDKSYFKEVDRIELSAAKVAAKAVKEKYGDVPISKISRGHEWTDEITGIKRLDKKGIKDYIKNRK